MQRPNEDAPRPLPSTNHTHPPSADVTGVNYPYQRHAHSQQKVYFSDLHRDEYKQRKEDSKIRVSASTSTWQTTCPDVTTQFQQKRPWRRRAQTWFQKLCNKMLINGNEADSDLGCKPTLELEKKEVDVFAQQIKDLQLPRVLEQGVITIMKRAGQLNGVNDSPMPSTVSRKVTVERSLMGDISRVAVTLVGYHEISNHQWVECIDQVASVTGDLFDVSSVIDRLEETVRISIDKKL